MPFIPDHYEPEDTCSNGWQDEEIHDILIRMWEDSTSLLYSCQQNDPDFIAVRTGLRRLIVDHDLEGKMWIQS